MYQNPFASDQGWLFPSSMTMKEKKIFAILKKDEIRKSINSKIISPNFTLLKVDDWLEVTTPLPWARYFRVSFRALGTFRDVGTNPHQILP